MELPHNWRQVLERCNFFLVRREIADFIRISNKEAKAAGGQYIWQKETAAGWNKFESDPSFATACEFLEAAPFFFDYFVQCSAGGTLHRMGGRAAKDFRVGDYCLNTPLTNGQILRELSREEYDTFGRDSLQERLYHGRPTDFVGHRWNVLLGIVEGKLYQFEASLELSRQTETDEMLQNVMRNCELLIGTPTEEQQGVAIWDTNDGSVILQFASIMGTFATNLIVSSKGEGRYGAS